MDDIIDMQRYMMKTQSVATGLTEMTVGVSERTSILKVLGLDGETLTLKFANDVLAYATKFDKAEHVFKCSEDTFLNLLVKQENIRTAATLGHFTVENAADGLINLVELEKWAKFFDNISDAIIKGLRGYSVRS